MGACFFCCYKKTNILIYESLLTRGLNTLLTLLGLHCLCANYRPYFSKKSFSILFFLKSSQALHWGLRRKWVSVPPILNSQTFDLVYLDIILRDNKDLKAYNKKTDFQHYHTDEWAVWANTMILIFLIPTVNFKLKKHSWWSRLQCYLELMIIADRSLFIRKRSVWILRQQSQMHLLVSKLIKPRGIYFRVIKYRKWLYLS